MRVVDGMCWPTYRCDGYDARREQVNPEGQLSRGFRGCAGLGLLAPNPKRRLLLLRIAGRGLLGAARRGRILLRLATHDTRRRRWTRYQARPRREQPQPRREPRTRRCRSAHRQHVRHAVPNLKQLPVRGQGHLLNPVRSPSQPLRWAKEGAFEARRAQLGGRCWGLQEDGGGSGRRVAATARTLRIRRGDCRSNRDRGGGERQDGPTQPRANLRLRPRRALLPSGCDGGGHGGLRRGRGWR